MEGSVENVGAPESWEVADLDETMKRLMLVSSKDFNKPQEPVDASRQASSFASPPSSTSPSDNLTEDAYNQVDQFLREALQNPRERLSILRMEQDIVKFIRDPTQHKLEFQQLPTSYLRLAAHRMAQHYSLQSMVLPDNNLPDSPGFTIIVHKTPECRLPPIRLADIPVNLPLEESVVVKVAIKQRPQKRSQGAGSANSNSMKANRAKSVEERKEEYNRARERIFNANSVSGNARKSESESRLQNNSLHGSMGNPKMEEKSIPLFSDINAGRGSVDSSSGSSSSTSARNRMEKEPVGRYKPNNRVAIFRDREIERKDPDYDRNSDRYVQRFDPGFGFSGEPYAIQPMYTPAVNYNTEFPQLGAAHRPQISAEHQTHPLPQHLPAQWAATSTHAGLAYGPPETILTTFSPNHVGEHSTAAMYLHSSLYHCQHPGMPFIHSHEHIHQPFPQSHQQQPMRILDWPGPGKGLEGACTLPTAI